MSLVQRYGLLTPRLVYVAVRGELRVSVPVASPPVVNWRTFPGPETGTTSVSMVVRNRGILDRPAA